MTPPSERPRFTVVVPALDEAGQLACVLESLHAQDFTGGVEIVVVDNGSRDETAAVARAAQVQVICEPVRGVCAARQRGTDVATGQVVVSTDADTLHPPHWLSRIDDQLRGHPEAVAVAGPCAYADAPWWADVAAPLAFAAVNVVHAWTGRVVYISATNTAFYRDGFPGYDTRLTQGGDEVALLRRLRRWGPVVWDASNEVTTSSRRLDQGLAYTLLVSFGYYYAASGVLDRLPSRKASVQAPSIRRVDERDVSRRRRRWGVVTAATLALLVGGQVARRWRRR